jgi:hypothetical protein
MTETDNPYWNLLKDEVESTDDPYPFSWGRRVVGEKHRPGTFSEAWVNRRGWCRQYAWAIPSPEALDWMVERLAGRSVVEIGAGTGYWAWQLLQRGVHVSAYDEAPPGRHGSRNHYHSPQRGPDHEFTDEPGEQFFPVKYGSSYYAGLWPDKVLYLSWPPYAEAMASKVLARFVGDELIYCGEGEGGCTGDDEFHDLLRDEWERVDACRDHVVWYGVHDELIHYRRRR